MIYKNCRKCNFQFLENSRKWYAPIYDPNKMLTGVLAWNLSTIYRAGGGGHTIINNSPVHTFHTAGIDCIFVQYIWVCVYAPLN